MRIVLSVLLLLMLINCKNEQVLTKKKCQGRMMFFLAIAEDYRVHGETALADNTFKESMIFYFDCLRRVESVEQIR